MGKIRVKTIGDESLEEQQKAEAKKRKEAKKNADASRHPEPAIAGEGPLEGQTEAISEIKQEETANTPPIDEVLDAQNQNPTDSGQANATEKKTSSYKEKVSGKQANKHSHKYLEAAQMLDKNKIYSISEALELLPKLHLAKFDETVELHINTTEKGVSGSMTLPHGTGKQVRVAIANDDIIKDIESGNITFDILLAEPQMMPKLAKVARILGPRGLMPNPKNGTVTPNPEEAAKKYAGGQINFKTEAKNPILHLSIGKLSFDGKKLQENYQTAITTIGQNKIKDVTLKSTMSPGIKVQI